MACVLWTIAYGGHEIAWKLHCSCYNLLLYKGIVSVVSSSGTKLIPKGGSFTRVVVSNLACVTFVLKSAPIIISPVNLTFPDVDNRIIFDPVKSSEDPNFWSRDTISADGRNNFETSIVDPKSSFSKIYFNFAPVCLIKSRGFYILNKKFSLESQ